MFKFNLGELVETETGAVGKVCELSINENGETYHLDFIDEVYEEYFVELLKKTTKTRITTIDGKSEEQVEAKMLDSAEARDKQEKAETIVDGINSIRRRYAGKCKDGNAFWKFFEEDVESLIYKEIGAEKELGFDTLRRHLLKGLPIYTSNSHGNPYGARICDII